MYKRNLISFGSRIWQQFSQSPRGAGEYIKGDPPMNGKENFRKIFFVTVTEIFKIPGVYIFDAKKYLN